MFELPFTVPEEDLTPIYKHIHHAQILRYLELGRLRFLESIGFPNDDFLKKGLFFVITDIQIRYKREIMAEPLIITCENFRIEDKSLVLDQRAIKAEKNKVAVEATVRSVFMDGGSKRAVPMPNDFLLAIREFK